MSEAPLLQARDLRKTYRLGRVDVPVLRGADFSMKPGEWVAILGSSGSGKSTLLHLLGLLDEPDAGSGGLWFEGNAVAGLRGGARNHYRNRSVGFVFQFYHLLPELNVLENALLPCKVAAGITGWPAARAEATDRVNSAAASVSAWRSRARWPTSRACCWPMNPPATWMRARAARSWT
jgi:lipoprotein-releasing system ATP-binding protein